MSQPSCPLCPRKFQSESAKEQHITNYHNLDEESVTQGTNERSVATDDWVDFENRVETFVRLNSNVENPTTTITDDAIIVESAEESRHVTRPPRLTAPEQLDVSTQAGVVKLTVWI